MLNFRYPHSWTKFHRLKDKFGYKTVAMVGDGATDMQAKPPADVFVGFGGIVERAVVKKGADIFVHDFEVLTDRIKQRWRAT